MDMHLVDIQNKLNKNCSQQSANIPILSVIIYVYYNICTF